MAAAGHAVRKHVICTHFGSVSIPGTELLWFLLEIGLKSLSETSTPFSETFRETHWLEVPYSTPSRFKMY